MPNIDNDTVTGTPDGTSGGTGTWYTVPESCEILDVSVRTIRRRIEQGKVDSKMEGNRRMVLITEEDMPSATSSANGTTDTVTGTPDGILDDSTAVQSELVDQLKSEVDFLRDRVKELEELRSQEKERADTIVLQLTRQLDQSQRLLEHNQESWYTRLFKRRNKPELD